MPKKSEEKTTKKEEKATKIDEAKEKKTKKVSQKDFEKKVLDLAESGLTAEKIGEKLRLEGIHPNDFDKKISKILKDNGKYIDPELKNVEGKLERIEVHLKKNKQDKRAIREKSRIFSQRRKIKKYLKMPLK